MRPGCRQQEQNLPAGNRNNKQEQWQEKPHQQSCLLVKHMGDKTHTCELEGTRKAGVVTCSVRTPYASANRHRVVGVHSDHAVFALQMCRPTYSA